MFHEASTRTAGYFPPQRALHLLDVENLLGGHVTASRVKVMWELYCATAEVEKADLVVAACSYRFASRVLFALPSRVRVVIGADVRDGADVALLEAVDAARQATRFARVVVGSGDHAFTPMAQQFAAAGCPADLVTGVGFVARRLRMVCRSHRRFSYHRLPQVWPIGSGQTAAAALPA
jgi:hypothetical protein